MRVILLLHWIEKGMKKELNLNYRETNSIDTIQNVYDGENNLGIVRFPIRDQDYYFNIYNDDVS